MPRVGDNKGMNVKRLMATALVAVGLASSTLAQSTLFDRGGGLIYDDVFDITWLQDVNYAATSGYAAANAVDYGWDMFGYGAYSNIYVDGRMGWLAAMTWVDTLSYFDSVRGVTYTDWRLPDMRPGPRRPGYQYWEWSNNGTQAVGYGATNSGWGKEVDADGIWSELGWMYYHNLGNLGACVPNDANPQSCVAQLGSGLLNIDPFLNMRGTGSLWTGLQYNYCSQFPPHSCAWLFSLGDGYQDLNIQYNAFAVWAVRDGDVAFASEPATFALLGLGIAGLGFSRRRS
jgi:hypothetical protein